MEWIDGHTVRSLLGDSEDFDGDLETDSSSLNQYGVTQGKHLLEAFCETKSFL